MKVIIIIASVLTFLYLLGELYVRHSIKVYRFIDALIAILLINFLSMLNPITWVVYGIRVVIEKINEGRKVYDNT